MSLGEGTRDLCAIIFQEHEAREGVEENALQALQEGVGLSLKESSCKSTLFRRKRVLGFIAFRSYVYLH